MKFNPIFTAAAGVLFMSLEMCAAAPPQGQNSSSELLEPLGWEWDTCAPYLYTKIAESNLVVSKKHTITTYTISTVMLASFIPALAGLG
ncbi:hypothetical protein ACJ72_08517, partial [Emergomyces africanus]